MITVSNDFKNLAKNPTKTVSVVVTLDDDSTITGNDNLASLKFTTSAQILKTAMRMVEFEYFDSYAVLGTWVNVKWGFVQAVMEYIDLGSFYVTEITTDKATGKTKAKAYDKMYLSLQLYDITPTFPLTLLELTQAICTELGWTLGTISFPNDDVSTEDVITGLGLTYRDVLDDIAEASGSVIYFSGDTLTIKEVNSASAETLLPANLISLNLENKFGEVNSVVLSRMPQNDNILEKDDASIALNGLTEIKIVNNILVDLDRETNVGPIFNSLFHLEYYPFRSQTEGLGWYEVGDTITVTDLASVTYKVLINEIVLEFGAGIKEYLKGFIPDTSQTNYNYAGVVGQRIKDTEIIVNKQDGEIELLNTTLDGAISSISLNSAGISSLVSAVALNTADIESINSSIVSLTQTANDLTVAVEGIGGVNLLKNSVGLKGDLEVWEEIGDAGNTGTITQTADVELNSESGSGITLAEQYIQQTVTTIPDSIYTLYCRFKKTGNANADITGIGNIDLAGDEGVWTVFKYTFTASGGSTTIKFENGAGETCIITDIIFKLGDVNGWTPAPNEVYGSNYRFDKDGFEITSLTDTFKSVLDNTKFAVYDTTSGTDKNIMVVSKDYAKVTQLTAQEQFSVQRYENSASSLRIVPTATGAMFVINN